MSCICWRFSLQCFKRMHAVIGERILMLILGACGNVAWSELNDQSYIVWTYFSFFYFVHVVRLQWLNLITLRSVFTQCVLVFLCAAMCEWDSQYTMCSISLFFYSLLSVPWCELDTALQFLCSHFSCSSLPSVRMCCFVIALPCCTYTLHMLLCIAINSSIMKKQFVGHLANRSLNFGQH